MSNTLYFLRNRSSEKAYKLITDRYGLELDYARKREKIYTNDDMIMSVAKRYIMFYIFGGGKETLLEELTQIMDDR